MRRNRKDGLPRIPHLQYAPCWCGIDHAKLYPDERTPDEPSPAPQR